MTENDFELISRTLDGQITAFDHLMKKYEKAVYNVAYGFGKSKDNALDILQNVFLKSYQKLSSFRGQSSYKSWLLRIAYNEGVNWVRNNKKNANNIHFDEQIESTLYIPAKDETLAKEHKSQLIHCLYNLNTRYRLAVVLRYFEDQPIKEIAHVLDCSEGVVKNMLYRSLRKLKESLQAEI